MAKANSLFTIVERFEVSGFEENMTADDLGVNSDASGFSTSTAVQWSPKVLLSDTNVWWNIGGIQVKGSRQTFHPLASDLT